MPADEKHPVVAGLRWILANRATTSDGKKMSMRALSLAAGLTHSHVEQILGGRQSPDVERTTANGLARAGNVRLEWLLTGRGERESYEASSPTPTVPERFVEETRRYENLEDALRYWGKVQPGRWTPETIAAARSTRLESEEDHNPADWVEYLDQLETALRGVRRIGSPREALAEQAPRPPRGMRRK